MKQDLFWHGICHLFVKIGNAPTPVVVHVKMECVYWIREVLTLDNPSMVSVPLCTKLEMSDINKGNQGSLWASSIVTLYHPPVWNEEAHSAASGEKRSVILLSACASCLP